MRRPALAAVLVALAPLAAPAPARATLVYVRHAATARPQVWAAHDRGGSAHRLGAGTFPVVSANGRRVAWEVFGTGHDTVRTRLAAGGHARTLLTAGQAGDLALSPNGKRLAVALARRIEVVAVPSGRVLATVRGRSRGFSFSGDGARLVYAVAHADDPAAPVDLRVIPATGGTPVRLTSDGRSLNPTWGPGGTIAFDRQTPRTGDAPTYQLWTLQPDGTGLRRLTRMKVPPLLSGLVALQLSGDGRRLLAEFEGEDASLGYTVDVLTGHVHALARALDTGFAAADLSRDGHTVLGMTGAPDAGGPHDVVTVPYGGGGATVLVRDAAFPHWSRGD